VETEIVEIKHPRKTYIRGTLRGKYWADADEINKISNHSEHFNLNVYEGEIRVEETHKHDQGEFAEYVETAVSTTVLPNPIILHFKTKDFQETSFSVQLHEPKLKNIILDKIVVEPDQRFGRIRAEIQGYILDEVSEFVDVEIVPKPDILVTRSN
jgi:hypothetical protein